MSPEPRTPHPICAQLAKLRADQGIDPGVLAGQLGIHPLTQANRESGKHDTYLCAVSDWAARFGFELALVPLNKEN